MKEHAIPGAAGGNVEVGGAGLQRQAVRAVVGFEKPQQARDGHQVADAARHLQHHPVRCPPRSTEIARVAIFTRAVALVDIHTAGVENPGEPFLQDGVDVARPQAQMAFGYSDANARLVLL